MRIFTVHVRPRAAPVLLREGFSLGAFLLGPFWLLWQRAWIPAILVACGWIALAFLPSPAGSVGEIGLAWAVGLSGRDLVRWSLERRGFLFAHVLAAQDEDAALARLLAARPELASEALA